MEVIYILKLCVHMTAEANMNSVKWESATYSYLSSATSLHPKLVEYFVCLIVLYNNILTAKIVMKLGRLHTKLCQVGRKFLMRNWGRADEILASVRLTQVTSGNYLRQMKHCSTILYTKFVLHWTTSFLGYSINSDTFGCLCLVEIFTVLNVIFVEFGMLYTVYILPYHVNHSYSMLLHCIELSIFKV